MCKAVRWEAKTWPGPTVPVVLGEDLSWDQAERVIGADMKVRHYNPKRLHEGYWGTWDAFSSGPTRYYEITGDDNPLTRMGA